MSARHALRKGERPRPKVNTKAARHENRRMSKVCKTHVHDPALGRSCVGTETACEQSPTQVLSFSSTSPPAIATAATPAAAAAETSPLTF